MRAGLEDIWRLTASHDRSVLAASLAPVGQSLEGSTAATAPRLFDLTSLRHDSTRILSPAPYFHGMLRPAPYLTRKLTRPLRTKDGGTLRTVLDARTGSTAPNGNGRPNYCLAKPT
jgi:hypothetical protein